MARPTKAGQKVDWPVALADGVARFRAKEKWGGAAPAVVLANPAQAENGLKSVAAALGLVTDKGKGGGKT